MLLTEDQQVDLFVATKIGSFKHIKYHTDGTKNSKKCIENLVDIKTLEKDDSITCMAWGNEEQTEIIIGKKNKQVQIYKTDQVAFTKSYVMDVGEGDVVGVGRSNRRILAAVNSGIVKIWSKKGDMDIDTGGKLDAMTVCPDEPTLFATGGEENDLKIWQIGEKSPMFAAKNLPNDWLQLRREVWVSGVCFLAGTKGTTAAVASRHGYVRLYDSRVQRRPVSCVDFDKMAATCITQSFDDRKVLVGFGRGQLHQVDLRVNKPDKGYKGCAGAVTHVQTLNLGSRFVVSTSLDRHLRIHNYDGKELVYKQYLTSKLSQVLVQSKSSTPLVKEEDEIKEEEKKEADEMDELFDNMETVSEKSRKKKLLLEDSAAAEESETEEDRIAKLLKSTEKKKRKLEKIKKERKAKSVFHNA